MIVTKFGGVGEVWHKNIQRLQIWCFTENKPIRNEYFVVSTNRQQVLYCVNQSEVSIILCQPIRSEYYIVSTNQSAVITWRWSQTLPPGTSWDQEISPAACESWSPGACHTTATCDQTETLYHLTQITLFIDALWVYWSHDSTIRVTAVSILVHTWSWCMYKQDQLV